MSEVVERLDSDEDGAPARKFKTTIFDVRIDIPIVDRSRLRPIGPVVVLMNLQWNH